MTGLKPEENLSIKFYTTTIGRQLGFWTGLISTNTCWEWKKKEMSTFLHPIWDCSMATPFWNNILGFLGTWIVIRCMSFIYHNQLFLLSLCLLSLYIFSIFTFPVTSITNALIEM